jgi:hypothetical protein
LLKADGRRQSVIGQKDDRRQLAAGSTFVAIEPRH